MRDDFMQTPSANRVRIGFFGVRNAGKSSLINAVAGQAVSIVSEVRGTTTDPVKKAMELPPLGPVLLIDTPGLDDEGELGAMRVERAFESLELCDLAVLVIDGTAGPQRQDRELLSRLRAEHTPFLIVYTKADLIRQSGTPPDTARNGAADALPSGSGGGMAGEGGAALSVSAKTGQGVAELKARLAALGQAAGQDKKIVGDLLQAGDLVVLVAPIDGSAPKGRMILPQVQTIRDILDARAACLIAQPEQLPAMLSALSAPPKLIVTDSQAFETVKGLIPASVPLTSFSILMARFKGVLGACAAGARRIASLRDGDRVLLSEGCTHRRQCQDIGTVKLPGWIRRFCGKQPRFDFTSGGDFPRDLSPYALVVHCGGCMLGEKEMRARLRRAREQGVPFTNYGAAIAFMNGILERGLEPFPPESMRYA